MTGGGQANDAWHRGELLINLRNGLRQSSRLAEQLAKDALIGHEVRALMGRLQAIRTELDSLSAVDADQRRAHNDPFWNDPRPAVCPYGSMQAGM